MRKFLSVLAFLTFLAGCSWSTTDTSTFSCVYNGGPFDSKTFRQVLEPGSGRTQIGVGSTEVRIPTRLITYQISMDPAIGDTPTADSLDVNVGGMVMQFEPTVNFKFNTALQEVDGLDKPVACSFYETHLKPFGATDFNDEGGDWQYGFLASRFRPSVDVAGIRVLQSFSDPVAMYFNTDGYRDQAQEAFGFELQEELARVLGSEPGFDYFCGPSHTYASDTCGEVQVILPQPIISQDDLAILSAPQRARTEANASIAQAQEKAREAEQVAAAREREAEFAEQKANADERIAEQEARTIEVESRNDYAWCDYLIELGESCWLVKAAENNGLPNVMTGVNTEAPQIVVEAGN